MSSASAPPRPSSAGSAAAGADAKQSTSVPACASSSPLFADAPAVAETAVKRSEITAEEKLRVLAWHHANGCNQRRTAAHFQAQEPKFGRLNQGTVSRWLLSENKFKAQVRSHQPTVIRAKSVRHPQVERCLALWLDRMPLDQYYTLTGKKVKSMLEAMNLAKAAWLTVEVGAIEACWVQAQVLSNEMVDEGRWSEVVHSSIHVDNLLLVNPLQELQESLNALASESHKSQKNLVLHNAGDFVKLDLQNALGTSLSVPEIVTLARMDVGNSVHSSNDSTTTTITTCITGGKGADSTVHYLPSAELPGTNMALPQPSWMDPNDVLNSLLIMESHWRATEMELPSEVLDLLVLTRENLQQEFASRQN
ncbi:hypothetical protein PHYPSEUDO_009583 [Phytophthora pseudosyringae]|uniref:HTH CENPB-type domain-containing protein n=1 Tax=Phytophthora pseudosyringae TaxID=221518 RepID=A0A8T1WNT1_9STRA|nr:hypothetical protein PHYPSEUDO_009583 [Phytophthora pseudosyringae]